MNEAEHEAGTPGFILLLTGALYLAQGIPLGVAFSVYPAILRDAGASLAMLAWLPVVGLPWLLKFLWSPLVDNCWSARLGRRRTWLLSQQALMIATFVVIAMVPITVERAPLHLALFAAASLFAATQDVATDGLAAERLRGGALLYANTFAVGGMVLGMIVGGGGLLMAVAWIGAPAAILGLACVLLLCAVPTMLWREHEIAPQPKHARASLFAVRRPGFWMLLAVAVTFAAGHSVQGAITKLMLVDQKWQLAQIGALESTTYLAMLVLGCGTASWAVTRFGPWVCLVVSQIVVGLTSLGLAAITGGWLMPNVISVSVLRAFGAGGMGLSSVAAFTIIMLFARRGHQAGTDVTTFKSGNVLGELGFASAGTAIASAAGYTTAFGFGAVAALSTLGLVIAVARSQPAAVPAEELPAVAAPTRGSA